MQQHPLVGLRELERVAHLGCSPALHIPEGDDEALHEWEEIDRAHRECHPLRGDERIIDALHPKGPVGASSTETRSISRSGRNRPAGVPASAASISRRAEAESATHAVPADRPS